MVAYCKKHIRAGILCSAVLLAVLPSLGYTETVKDFRDPEGRLFEDYRYFPPALVARAKVLFDEGYFINTDLYKFIKKEYGFQAAEDFRFWWISSELIKHQEK